MLSAQSTRAHCTWHKFLISKDKREKITKEVISSDPLFNFYRMIISGAEQDEKSAKHFHVCDRDKKEKNTTFKSAQLPPQNI